MYNGAPADPGNPIISVRHVRDGDQIYDMHYFWCPGCDDLHGLAIFPGRNSLGAGWVFTGTLGSPTYAPSVRTSYPESKQCHIFITAGMINFLDDSNNHELRGNHPMIPVPDWLYAEEKKDLPKKADAEGDMDGARDEAEGGGGGG